jgi:hypothetical protein
VPVVTWQMAGWEGGTRPCIHGQPLWPPALLAPLAGCLYDCRCCLLPACFWTVGRAGHLCRWCQDTSRVLGLRHVRVKLERPDAFCVFCVEWHVVALAQPGPLLALCRVLLDVLLDSLGQPWGRAAGEPPPSPVAFRLAGVQRASVGQGRRVRWLRPATCPSGLGTCLLADVVELLATNNGRKSCHLHGFPSLDSAICQK